MKKALVPVSLIMVIALAGCKATMPEERGFLSDYSKLQPRTSASMAYVDNQKVGSYSKFIVDPVQAFFYYEADKKKVDIDRLTYSENYLRNSLISELEKNGYQVVSQPGPGVARIRLALTDIKKGTPVLNVIPHSAIAGVGLGGASVEGEIVDSQTNEQVAAGIESQLGKRFTMAGLSKYGHAEMVLNNWVQRIVQRINETHGK